MKQGYGEFYKNVISAGGAPLTQIERQNPDLAKPFGLYSSRVKLTMHERINVLERETVKAFIKRESEMRALEQQRDSENSSLFGMVSKLDKGNNVLRKEIANQKRNLQKTLDEWALDREKRDDLLQNVTTHYQQQIKTFEQDVDTLSSLFVNEISVKDNIIGQVNSVKEAFIEKTRRLLIKLKMPREHFVFMMQAGKLEEFVEAKLLGQDPIAKWQLTETAKEAIDTIEIANKGRYAGLRERGIEVDDAGGLEVLKAPRGKVSVPFNKDKIVFVSSYTKKWNEPFDGAIKGLQFRELPSKRVTYDSRK